MLDDTVALLLALNRQFYQTFALQFSATRQRVQPGVRRIIATLPAHATILDLGCGNGELARELERNGYSGGYTGLDFSPALLDEARKLPLKNLPAVFIHADIASVDWIGLLSGLEPDFVFAFAVLHHLPGEGLRLQVLRQVRRLLAPQGRFVLSLWQFLNSPRMQRRIQPWKAAGIGEQQVDPGDYLLDWRSGGQGLRYVHHFSEAELANLAGMAGFDVCESFFSDGEGGRLGLYQVWAPGSPG